MKGRDNRRGDLHHQPADNGIGDRNLVNVAPLQLGEKILRLHFDASVRMASAFFSERRTP
jgi:hypothetical protein